MKHHRSTFYRSLAMLGLVAACVSGAVHADEYTDVGQLIRANKFPEALVKTENALANKPKDPQMLFYKGVILRNTGKMAEAISTFTKLTEEYPELPEPYNNLAVLYASQNQYDKARTALEMAIRTNPSYATAHENLGDVYARLASQAYNKALQLEGANPAVQPKLALIRELFNPAAKGQRPSVAASATPAPTPAPAGKTAAPAVPAAPAVSAAVSKPASAPAPVASVATRAPVSPATSKPVSGESAKAEVTAAVRAWAKAWAAKDVPAYLAAYGKQFTPATKQSRSAWEADRRQRITGKSTISVKIENLSVTVQGNQATAKFRQDYRADALSVSSRKTLDLVKSGDQWLITRESTGH